MESERDSSVTSRKSSYVEKEEKESKTNPVLIGSAVLAALGLVLVIIWFLTWNSTTNELPEAQSLKAERTNSSNPQTQTEENANISAQNPGSSPHRQKKVCKTRECIALSHQLNNFGDKSVDPCVNFYQHACGRYTEQLNADTLGLWKTKLVEKVINEYLYKNKNVGTNSTSERIIKQMFGLCLKMENDENEFFETFYRDVWADVQKVGLWPMIDQKFNESTFNLARYLENMSEKLDMAHFGLFKLATYPKTLINEDEGSLDSTSSEEKKQIKSLASFNNFQIDESTLENDIEDVDKLRQKLKKIVDKRNRLRPVDYDEIMLKNPLINIETILKKYQSRKRPEIQNFIQENIISIEMFTTQNDSLHQLILDTPPRTMANFLIMRVVQRAFELIDLGPRQSCIAFVIDKMGQAALRIFVRNFFKKENIKLGKELVESIIKAYLKMFENSSWLVQKTKDSAISKIKKMNYIVGYPDEFEAPGALDQLYDELVDVSPSDSFYLVNRKITGFNSKRIMDDSARRITFTGTTMLAYNAVYNRNLNAFAIAVPGLDDPFLDPSMPKVAGFAGIGSIIGHEIGHGFDRKGAKFDSDGKKWDWWDPKDMEEFGRREKCVIDQYENYDDPSFGKNLNGTTTAAENVADLLGTTAIWNAYNDLNAEEKEIYIVGLEDYSSDKLFFHIRAAQMCSVFDTQSLESRLKFSHGVTSFRVNGVFANMESFAKTFQCPTGSPMNPVQKCKIF